MSLLEVEGLRVSLQAASGMVTVVDGVDYHVEEGEVFGDHAARAGRPGQVSMLAAARAAAPSEPKIEGRVGFDGSRPPRRCSHLAPA